MCAGVPYAEPTIVPAVRPRRRRWHLALAIAPIAAAGIVLGAHRDHAMPLSVTLAMTESTPSDWRLGLLVLAAMTFVTLVCMHASTLSALDRPRWMGRGSARSSEILRWLQLGQSLGISELQMVDALERGAHASQRAALRRVREAVLDDTPLLRAVAEALPFERDVAMQLKTLRWTRGARPFDELRRRVAPPPPPTPRLSDRPGFGYTIAFAVPVLVVAIFDLLRH